MIRIEFEVRICSALLVIVVCCGDIESIYETSMGVVWAALPCESLCVGYGCELYLCGKCLPVFVFLGWGVMVCCDCLPISSMSRLKSPSSKGVCVGFLVSVSSIVDCMRGIRCKSSS